MERKDFCKMMASARKSSGLTLREICLRLKLADNAIYNLENGQFNNTLRSIFHALKIYGAKLYVQNENKSYSLDNERKCVALLRLLRSKAGYSREYIARQIGTTQQTLYLMENGKSKLSIDMFLKLMGFWGFNIFLKNDTTGIG